MRVGGRDDEEESDEEEIDKGREENEGVSDSNERRN